MVPEQKKGSDEMQGATIFLIVAVAAFAIAVFMYWQESKSNVDLKETVSQDETKIRECDAHYKDAVKQVEDVVKRVDNLETTNKANEDAIIELRTKLAVYQKVAESKPARPEKPVRAIVRVVGPVEMTLVDKREKKASPLLDRAGVTKVTIPKKAVKKPAEKQLSN